MPGALEPISRREAIPVAVRLDRRTAAQLEAVDKRTLVREAKLESEGTLAQTKARELGRTAREGLTDVALVHSWAVALANGDPLLFDRLTGLVNVLTVTVSEVLADLSDTYCREGRR